MINPCPFCGYTGEQFHFHCANCGVVGEIHFTGTGFICPPDQEWLEYKKHISVVPVLDTDPPT